MGSYKTVTHTGVLSQVSDAINDLQELGSECREIVDNASEGLQQTNRIQTLDTTAGELEGINEPEVPKGFGDLPISYTESVNKNKRRGPSRFVRASNAAVILNACAESARAKAEALKDEQENMDHIANDEDQAKADALQEQQESLESFADECEEIAGMVEGLEFPGMYG